MKNMPWLELKENLVLAIKDLNFILIQASPLKKILKRRDFTINAMAKDDNGNIIDPFEGRARSKK